MMKLDFLKKPTCALCKLTEPLGLAREISFVLLLDGKEQKLCRFCWQIAHKERRLGGTVFPPEFDTSVQKRRAWLVQEYNRLNPVGQPVLAGAESDEPDILPIDTPGGETSDTETLSQSFPCPSCQKLIEIPEGRGGETIDCPHCCETVEVPLTPLD